MAVGKNREDTGSFKMNMIRTIFRILSSKTFTVWMITVFVIYYLTTAVWLGEAFGRYIILISKNNIARAVYCIFFLNISLILLNGLWSVRRNYLRLLLRAPLYIGIITFLASSFLSINLRSTRWMLFGEGDVINLPWEMNLYKIVSIESALEKNILRMDDSPVFDYEPYAMIIDEIGQSYRIRAFPAKKVGDTYMHILNFGIAPVIELIEDGRTVVAGPVALRLIPFGVVGSFELKEFNYNIYLTIIPNGIIKKGDEIARKYNIEKPRYHIQVIKGDRTILEDSAEDEVAFDERLLRFYKPIFWIQLELVHDPVYPFFIGSLIMTILGLIPYPFSLLKKK